jgi:acyl carrier protein
VIFCLLELWSGSLVSNNLAIGLRSPDEIRSWIVDYLSDLLEADADEIDVTVPFDRYGLDSSAAVGLTGDLEDWMGVEVSPTLLYDYPTVEALVDYLSKG